MASTTNQFSVTREIIDRYVESFGKIAKLDEKIIREIWNDPTERVAGGITLCEHLLEKYKYSKSAPFFIQRMDSGNKERFYKYFSLANTSEVEKVCNFFATVQSRTDYGTFRSIWNVDAPAKEEVWMKTDGNGILFYFSLPTNDREKVIRWANILNLVSDI